MEQVYEFIKPELLVLIPVLYFLGVGVKASNLDNRFIPLILGGFGVILATIYTFSQGVPIEFAGICTAIFAGVTQGILCAGCCVYVNQLYKQSKEEE